MHGRQETAEVCHVRRTGGGESGLYGGAEKKGMGCLQDVLRAFGINADQWTTAVQDEGEWRKTAEQGAERFMAKLITAEKASVGLQHTVYSMHKRDGKDQGKDSPTQACSSWFSRQSLNKTLNVSRPSGLFSHK